MSLDALAGTTAEPSIRFSDDMLRAINARKRLNSAQASVFMEMETGLAISEATLKYYRCTGGGPAFGYAGRTAVYDKESLLTWALGRCRPGRCA